MLLTITPLYAGLLALLFLLLSVRVVAGRRGQQISLGDGGDARMLRRIRAHGNLAEYAPLILLMMAMLEIGGLTAAWLLHALGLALLAGRVLHAYALSVGDRAMLARIVGMVLTFGVLTTAALLCIWRGVATLLLHGT